MVKKLTVVAVLVLLNMGALAVEVDSLGYSVSKPIPWDTVVASYRKLAVVSDECFMMVEKGMKSEGVVGYIRKHKDVFLPIIIFILLYGIWLAKRERSGKY